YLDHIPNITRISSSKWAVTLRIGGSALVCLFLPFYEKMYGRVPKKWRVVLGMAFLLVFIMDAAYCAVHPNMGKGISS
ncbi:MAG: hypothetical protein K2N55_04185, partial [Lachnospiraceae bacterium]|nr:hypothetical protein [Lachnospiraceae bacterium]